MTMPNNIQTPDKIFRVILAYVDMGSGLSNREAADLAIEAIRLRDAEIIASEREAAADRVRNLQPKRKLSQKEASGWMLARMDAEDIILAEMQAVRERTIEECKAAMCDFDCQDKFNQCKDPCGAGKALDALKERKDADAE
jgi:hypothetical protein